MSAKKILRDYVATNDLEKVLQGLFYLAEKYGDERILHNTTIQSGRLRKLGSARHNNTIPHDQAQLIFAQIMDALLYIINDVPDDWEIEGIENQRVPSSPISNNKWKKYTVFIAGGIAVLAGVSGYDLRDVFENDEKSEIPFKHLTPKQSVTSFGNQSPAVITEEGNVNISYGETHTPKDSTKKQNPDQ